MNAAQTTGAAAVWVLGSVIAVDPAGWYPFGPSKWLVVSTGVCALAATTLATSRVTVVPRVQLAMVGLVAVMALAAVWALDAGYAWTGTPERHFGVVTWTLLAVAFAVGVNLVQPARLLWGIAAAGAALGVAATAEALGWEPRVFDVDDRLSATFGSPAYLGAAVAVLLPIAVGIALDTTLARRLRSLAAIGTPLLVVAVLGSGARAAWLGLTLAAFSAGWRQRRKLVPRYSARVWTLAAAVVVITGAAVVVLSPVGPRLSAAFDADAPGGSGRLDEWRVATRVARNHLALGVGPEGYRIAFADGVDADYERSHGRTPAPDRAHSTPLDVLLTGGLAALVIWSACVVLVGRHVWRALGDDRVWIAGVAAALVAHFGGLMVLFPLAEIEPIVWLLAGVVVAGTARPHERRVWVISRSAVTIAAGAALVALAAGITDVVADRRAHRAVDARSRGDAEAAFVHASSAASLRPDELRLHLLKAETARAADRGIVVALDAIDDARAVSPLDPIVVTRRAALLVDRAEATLVPEHAAEATAALADSLRNDPLNAELRVLEGRAARIRFDDDAAEQAWLTAEDLAPQRPTPAAYLALLYVDQGRNAAARDAIGRASKIAPDDPFVRAVRAKVEESS